MNRAATFAVCCLCAAIIAWSDTPALRVIAGLLWSVTSLYAFKRHLAREIEARGEGQ